MTRKELERRAKELVYHAANAKNLSKLLDDPLCAYRHNRQQYLRGHEGHIQQLLADVEKAYHKL